MGEKVYAMTPLKPFELSIGNLLNYDTGEGIELTVIDWQDLKWLQEEPDFFANHFSPVPLTPEILEGFGFAVGMFNLLTLFVGAHELTYRHNALYMDDLIGLSDIQHAHTLQNLVTAISGVELVYKPNKAK